MKLFHSLKNRSFALLWTGQTVSRIGDFVYQIALAWWVLQKTGSAKVMGTVLICSFTPMLLFVLIGGVTVDRFSRTKVMLISDIVRGILVGGVAVLAFLKLLEVWHVYVASVLFGLADAFFQPAYAAVVPEVTPPEDLMSANSLTSLSLQVGRVAGPALGAGVVAWGGTATAFAADALSFFISAACLFPLRGLPAPRRDGTTSSSVMREMREGFGTVLKSRWLWCGMLVIALINISLSGPFSVAIPFLVKQMPHANVGLLGTLYSTFAVGAGLAAIWLGRFTKFHRRGVSMYCGVALAGLGMLAIGLPIALAFIFVAALVNGAALEVGGLIWTNTLQELVPAEQLGRVSSIDSLGTFVLMPVGFAMAGWATDRVGPARVCVAGGALTIVLAAVGLLQRSVRMVD